MEQDVRVSICCEIPMMHQATQLLCILVQTRQNHVLAGGVDAIVAISSCSFEGGSIDRQNGAYEIV